MSTPTLTGPNPSVETETSTSHAAGADIPRLRRPGAESAERRFEALYRLHAAPLYRYLVWLSCGNRQLAQDLLQETLLRAWRNLDGLYPNIELLRPWLFTVARRHAIDSARARRVRPQEVGSQDVATMPAPTDDIDRFLAIETVRRALRTLSPLHQEILIEVYYRDRSLREAAELLGIPEGTAKSRTYYALKALRAALTDDERGPDRRGGICAAATGRVLADAAAG